MSKNYIALFYFFFKKVRPTDPSDTSTQMKIFNRNFIVSSKSMSISQTLISKYAKIYQQCYYFSICTLISIKLFEAWSTVKSKKLSNQSDRNLQNVYFTYIERILYVSRKVISKLSCVELKDVGTNWFIMQKDNPIAFKNVFSSILKYQLSVQQINEFKSRPITQFR